MPNTGIELFHYWRSSSSWRVRAALAYKKIPYQATHVHLLKNEHSTPEFLKINPAGAVPVMKTQEGILTESLAMIQYLEQTSPEHALLPELAYDRAKAWALAEIINSGTHPIQNLPVLQYVSSDPIHQKKWAQHWINAGLETYEALLNEKSNFSLGNTLTIADICLIPQCYNAQRFEVEMSVFPKINRVLAHCLSLECFQNSHPDQFKPID